MKTKKNEEVKVDVKALSSGVQDLRKTFSSFVEEFSQALENLETNIATAEGEESEVLRSLLFLKSIYTEGGMIVSGKLSEIADKHQYSRYGSFFKGKKSSLAKVHADGKEVVALTQYGKERLVKAGLIQDA